MPVVQTYGQPMANLPRAQDARLRAANAGDGGMAESIANFGKTLGQYADHEAKVRAEDLMLQADQRMKAVAQGYRQQLGRGAIDARGDTEKALSGAYDEIMGATDDPLIKNYLRPALEQYRGLYSGQIAEHGAQQERVYGKEVGSSRAANFAQNAIDNRDKPEIASQFIGSLKKQITDNLALDGLDAPEIVKSETRKAESGVHASIADSYLAEGDVDTANAYFQAHRDVMTGADETAIAARLKEPLQRREANGDAGLVMGSAWSDASGAQANYADPLRGMGKAVTSPFGAKRADGEVHNGVDFAAPRGTPIHSIGAGKVSQVGHDDRSGNFIIVDHGDGTTSSYAHMASAPDLKPGDVVTPDTVLGAVGTTGHSTGPHLHLVVREGGRTVDPQAVIGKAEQSPQRHDMDTLLARADVLADAQGWSIDRRDRAKDEIRRRVSMDEGLLQRKEQDADRKAQEVILAQREGFTDASAIPRPIWDTMSVSARQSAVDLATRNRKTGAEDIKPNGPAIMIAHAMMYSDPDKFRDMDLTPFVGQVNRAELDSLISEQSRLRNPANRQDVSPRSQVSETINYHTRMDSALDKALDPKKNPEAYGRVATDMEATLRAITGGKRQATDAEKDAAFTKATMSVMVKGAGFFGLSDKAKPRYELKGGEAYTAEIPDDVRQRIVESYRRTHGSTPNDSLISGIYVSQRGKPGFWQ